MRIHIHCPGSITDGLDSPSRGESRWTQNLARILAKEGHDIHVSGGGKPTWGSSSPVKNVTLIPEGFLAENKDAFGFFDINMDSAWWKDKAPVVNAGKHLILKWSMEDYTARERLPDNQYLCYPLDKDSVQFYEDRCVNQDKTFFLPLPFGDTFHKPNFDKKGLLWTSKDIERASDMRSNAKKVAHEVLPGILGGDSSLFMVWLMFNLLKGSGIDINCRKDKDIVVNGLLPYHKLKEVLEQCKLVVAINIPGSVLDAAFLGVPTLEWEEGGFYNHVGRKHGVLIEQGASTERIKEVISLFLEDEELYNNYVKDMQNELKNNLNSVSIKYFNEMVSTIF
jgi:hypothetical protein